MVKSIAGALNLPLCKSKDRFPLTNGALEGAVLLSNLHLLPSSLCFNLIHAGQSVESYDAGKRKKSTAPLSKEQHLAILNATDINTPKGLQDRLYFLITPHIVERGGKPKNLKISEFTYQASPMPILQYGF
jgi:hypothetical protein